MTEVRYAVADGVATITLDAPTGATPSRSRCRGAHRRGPHRRGRRGRRGRRRHRGPHFCAGAVRGVLADTGRDPVEDGAYRNLETVYRAFTTIGEVGVPTIAAVRGAAVGAGLNLALATDLRIVSRTARLLPGFAQIGIHPGGGHFTLLNRVAGREAAAAMGLFGEEVSGDRAVALGLAWAAYDDEDVEARGSRWRPGWRRTLRSPGAWSRASGARPCPAGCPGTSPSSSSARRRCGRCGASTSPSALAHPPPSASFIGATR